MILTVTIASVSIRKTMLENLLSELYNQIEINITNSQGPDRLDSILNPLGKFHIDS